MSSELDLICTELAEMHDLFLRVVKIIPSFDITDPEILPYGLKPHTRSVSWIVEQVIVQQAKHKREKLKIKDIEFNLPDTCLHDCEVIKNENTIYYVNIKITSAKQKQNKNDIAAVEKLFMQYSANLNYRLIYAVFQFHFNNTTIIFNKDKVHTFSPQFLPIYVNPRNDKLQAYYYAKREERAREDFLQLLKLNSRSIKL
ncbi:hypothetical protein [Candidatus Synechococcus spongiarum]|uniref:Uncharacterized protein n=1 Tax=Candidatus Synechococcus spongiarum TaxID=431041 RepID=A0A171DFH8_9SYNE|nr:hypothetical protein [Candidatus Synechococcus spongiarum]SAY38526.1 hypothetical protein FLM9_410 [Candidatus Synechococcus spongiarum]